MNLYEREKRLLADPKCKAGDMLSRGGPSDARDICWMDDNIETTDLDTLLIRNAYFEFEHGKLVSCS